MKNDIFRNLPRMDHTLENPMLENVIVKYGKENVKKALQATLNTVREEIKNGNIDFLPSEEYIVLDAIKNLNWTYKQNLKKVINGTGIIIHTNLGRSILSKNAIDRIVEISSSYSNLEFDIKEGHRGSRYVHVENLLKILTGAESALVVNNNASAVLLVLNELTKSKEVIVSRGELIEIGGSFRIPSVMELAGATLKEVGTTNRTHLSDYENAIDTEKTGALIKIHSSNFKIIGYTKEVSSSELASLGKKYNVPTIEDLGSGALIDLSNLGIDEKRVKDVINDGIDIAMFSGDKLLGGPQAGIIVGKKEYIDRLKKNQLLRALRVDKFTLAALEGTLENYLNEKSYLKIPIFKMINLDKSEIYKNLISFADSIKEIPNIKCDVADVEDFVGGGTLPTYKLEGKGLSIQLINGKINRLENYLRNYSTPIIGRVHEDKFILHGRTLQDNDFITIKEALNAFNKD